MKPFADMTLGELLLAFEKDPQSPDVNYAIGRKLMALEKYKVSIEYFQTCIALKPKFPEAYLALAELFEKTGDITTAAGFRTAAEKLFQEIDKENAARVAEPPVEIHEPQTVVPAQPKPRNREPRNIPATELLELPAPEPDASFYSTRTASTPVARKSPVSRSWSESLFDSPAPRTDDPDAQELKLWYYQFAGEEQGPCTIEELRGKAATGDIHRDTLIWRMGFRAWRRASDVEEMQSVLHVRPQSIPELLQSAPASASQSLIAPIVEPESSAVVQKAEPAEPAPIPEPVTLVQEPEPAPDALDPEPALSIPPLEPVEPAPLPQPDIQAPAVDAEAHFGTDSSESQTVFIPEKNPIETIAQDSRLETDTTTIAPEVPEITAEPIAPAVSDTPEISPVVPAPVAPVAEKEPMVSEVVPETIEPEPCEEPVLAQPDTVPDQKPTSESVTIAREPIAPAPDERETSDSASDLLSSKEITFEDLLPKSARRAHKKKPPREKPETAPRQKKQTRQPRDKHRTKTRVERTDQEETAKAAGTITRKSVFGKILNAATTLAAIALVAMVLVRAWDWYNAKNTVPPPPPSQTVEQYMDALHNQDLNGMEATFTSARAEALHEQNQTRHDYVASDFVTRSAISPDMRFTIRDVQKKGGQAVVQGVLTVPNSPDIDMKFVLFLEDNRWKIQFVDETIQGALSF